MRLLLLKLLVLHELPSLRSVRRAQDDSAPCTCDCCEVQERQGSSELICSLIQGSQQFRSSHRVQRAACPELCAHNSTDKVITTVEGEQMDYERFCFYECMASGNAGDLCGVRGSQPHPKNTKLAAIHQAHVHPPRGSHMQQASHVQKAAARALRRAGSEGPEWPSMEDNAVEIGLRAEAESKQAAKSMASAAQAAAASTKTADINSKIMPSLLASVEESFTNARYAHGAEKYATDLVKEVQKATTLGAKDVIIATLKEVRAQEHAKAKVEAQKAAKEMLKKMLAGIPAAAKAASQPYIDAMNRAHDYSAQYQKIADSLTAKSVGDQMTAQLMLGQANMWNSIGELPKAQTLFQQAHQMMDFVALFNKKAGAFYQAAAEVMSHDGEYLAEADQAAYHATVLRNPDAPPPPNVFS